MDLLRLKDLQFKLLYENGVSLPQSMQNSILAKNAHWQKQKRIQSVLSTFDHSRTRVKRSPNFPFKIIPRNSIEDVVTSETASILKLDLNERGSSDFVIPSRKTSLISQKRVYSLTFEMVEKNLRSKSKLNLVENDRTRMEKYPPLSPVAFASLARRDALPMHNYKSWAEINESSRE